jgi:hypothetical protein
MNATDSDVWSLAGAYTFCTTAGKWEVVSSDNTQDIGTVIKGDATGDTYTSTGGSTTSITDTGHGASYFTDATAVAVGDVVILDPHGTTPEWGYVTAVAPQTLTVGGGFSSGGTGASRRFAVVDKSAYTHAQVVKIEYLTSAFAEKSEIVVLNGATAVDTVNTDLYRVNSFRTIATGSSNAPKGYLTLRADGAAGNYSYITAGFTRARNSIYTVPAGKSLYVTHVSMAYATTGNANKEYARIYTRANAEPSTNFRTGSVFYPYTEVCVQNNTTAIDLAIPTKFTAGTDIKVSGIASASGVATSVLRGWLES